MTDETYFANSTEKLHTCAQLIEYIGKIGFLPLLNIGIRGWSADEVVDDDCQYVRLPDGGWDWPLWNWKGNIIQDSGCAYGKFFNKKAGFVSREWWPDFCNWRRSRFPLPKEDSIEATILEVLKENGSMITRELRAACGFTGPKMRGKFDAYVTKLEMGCRIVTEDFVYPHDRNGHEYGWGWALLTTPEALLGHECCVPERTSEESHSRIMNYIKEIMPNVSEKTISKIF